MCSQLYERVPLKVRKMVNDIFVMYRPSKKEIQMVCDELLEFKEDVAQQIYKIAFTKPYDWLFVDVPSQQIYANYNQLVISEDETK